MGNLDPILEALPAPVASTLAHIDTTTILSLGAVLLLLNTSYLASLRLLSRSTPQSLRILFIWHSFDFLIHTIFEGSYLYNCFFASVPIAEANTSADIHPAALVNFLGQPGRVFGAQVADNVFGKLWMVYAQADRRWAGADPTVISLELLTVLLAGPMALYICYGIVVRNYHTTFWIIVLATAELYGGWMTFAPEWITGSLNLDTSNFMFLWVYLFFFNFLWVVMPVYALYFAFGDVSNALEVRNGLVMARIEMAKRDRLAKVQGQTGMKAESLR